MSNTGGSGPNGTRERTGTIGCFGEGFWNTTSYWAHCMNGIRDAASARGVHVLLLPREYDPDAWGRVDGVVVCQSSTSPLPEEGGELPCVSIINRFPGLTSVVADDEGGAREATEYLLSFGHRQIASLILPDYNEFAQLRRAGYHAALKAAGIEPKDSWSRPCEGDVSTKTFTGVAREIMGQWVQEDWKKAGCTAIVTHNDDIALGVVQALNKGGLLVPEDVSVIGFDGTDVALYSMPPLTTVEVPLERIGHRGVELLMDEIEGRREVGEEDLIVLPTQMKLGDSVALPPLVPPGSVRKRRRRL